MTSCKKRTLFCDIETFSSVDISKSGAFRYIESEDFEILLLAYAWNDGPVQMIDLLTGEGLEELPDVLAGLQDPLTVKVAHNSAFERAAFHRHFGKYMPPEEWEDTMILAAYNGLPLSLDAVGAALNLRDQKIKEGTLLINYFCKPCKPTIANGGRTRNYPEHAPDKWERFKEYCRRDVEVCQSIYYRLSNYKATDFERKVWALDARINERGVMVDMDLVRAAIEVDEAFRAEHTDELKRLTGLDNPNSIMQLKEWLVAYGVEVETLNKATVGDLLKTVTDPTVRRVLELRQLLSKTSTKKYVAMVNAACNDRRIRGLTQYYGAARTGRWAGRLVQLQNLVQNHLDEIGEVREIVRSRDLGVLEMLYDSVPDTLSQLIRTALIAKPGHTFLVSDYAAIEARVIAYLAGEQWRMDVFAQGGDIYCSSASQMFKVPVEKHGINGHLRQKGKVAELACVAENQPVLTDRGLVPIQHVTADMKVWDGEEWVEHDGVVFRGEKEVMTYEGLTATPDHFVWVEGQSEPIRLEHAAASGAHLVQTGDGWDSLRVGGGHQPGEAVEQKLESLLHPDQMYGLRCGSMAEPKQLEKWEIERVSELFGTTTPIPQMVRQEVYGGEAALHESERQELQELRSERHRVPFPLDYRSVSIHDGDVRSSESRTGIGQDRRKRPLRAGESSMGDAPRELSKPTAVPRKIKVYDILNTGPRHRFTVSGVLVHNCGYGGGVAALKAFGADKMGLSDEEMQDIVTQWRQASPTIPKLWRDVEDAARRALEYPGRTFAVPCGVKYRKDKDALRCKLPSGRVLTYWNARLTDRQISFMGQNQTTRQWELTDTWGGKLVENIVQAVARDCLAVAMVRLEEAGWDIVFHVHDECVIEAPIGSRWEDVAEVMGQPIDWAPGLLLRGDGYETTFYRKD